MLMPQEVSVMLRLKELGWGVKRIARELGTSKNTVKRYLRAGGYTPYRQPQRAKALDGLEDWLKKQFLKHAGNADVVRQQLEAQHGLCMSLRSVERAVAPYRDELVRQEQATVRFETPPGRQLQVDFGTKRVSIGAELVKLPLCVLTLGYSRRIFVTPRVSERRVEWLRAIEAGFEHFAGVPQELLIDNAKALVELHDLEAGVVTFNREFEAFCRHWGVRPRACAPYRARTKGKDERSIQYVKGNALAGREFESLSALESHLGWWMREVADVRVHGTTGQRPIDRYRDSEAASLRPLAGCTPFEMQRELVRRVQTDCCVELDTNHYSVPWRFIGRRVRVEHARGEVRIVHAGQELARHAEATGRRQRVIKLEHLEGIVRSRADVQRLAAGTEAEPAAPAPVVLYELLRPLSEYEEVVGGAP
jgi:transposase